MTEVGRRPRLEEVIEALSAVCSIEADISALESDSETFRVILTFKRAQCPLDWREGLPKPTWLIDEALSQLREWYRQKCREQQWVSKEEQFGSSIDGLMAHYYEELKKQSSAVPSTMHTRMQTRMLSDTIVRLQELKERRQAGGVYARTESQREKARKTWAEEEYEAPKREEAQHKKQQTYRNYSQQSAYGDAFSEALFTEYYEYFRGHAEDIFDRELEDAMYGRSNPFTAPPPPPPKPQAGNKQPWYTILGVAVGATEDQIKKAHRKLIAKHQPRTSAELEDRARAEKMMEINTARDEGLAGL
jgi:hypothetical protein